jgi:hypothetical protein
MPRYDLFQLEGPVWFAAVENLQEVKKRVGGVGCDCLVFYLVPPSQLHLTRACVRPDALFI